MRRWIDVLRLRLRSLVRRDAVDRELERELRFHLDQRVAELVGDGHSPRAARDAAQREFGSPASIAEQCRDTRRVNFIHNVIQDLRYGARVLMAQPMLLVAATTSIALGVGANLTIFSLANSLLLSKPTAVRADELVHIRTGHGSHVPYVMWQALNESNVMAGIAGHRIEMDAIWRGRDASISLRPLIVTANFFDVVGVPVAIGRGFTAVEADVDRNPRLAVLTDKFWQRHHGGDPSILGQSMTLNGESYTIIGITPPGLRSLPGYGIVPDAFLPISRTLIPTIDRPADSHVQLIGRLDAGQSLTQATAALATVAQRFSAVHNDREAGIIRNVGFVGGVSQLKDFEEVALFFAALLIVTMLVLAIACANVAGLLLARGTARRREIGLRLALGASRRRVVQQLMTEGFLLSLLGTAGGMLITAAVAQLVARIAVQLPISFELNLAFDDRTLWTACGLVIVSAVICGLTPALHATRRSLTPALRQEVATYAHRRFNARAVLVAGQMAVSVVLLVTTALFVRNLGLARSLSPGFDAGRALLAQVTFDEGNQSIAGDMAVPSIIERLRALPGVETASYSNGIPLTMRYGGETGTEVRIEGRDTRVRVDYFGNSVGPEYFAAMGLDIVAGRDFTPADRHGAPAVVVVNQEFVRRYLSDAPAVGRHIFLPTGRNDETPSEVIGVVSDSKYRSIGEERAAAVYRAFLQGSSGRFAHVIVRTRVPPEAMTTTVRTAIMSADESAAVMVEPMTSAIQFALLPSRIGAILMGVLGVLGSVLAMIGLYGVVSFAVSRRTSEIGVRMALGASRSNVIRLVLKDSAVVVAVGVVVGLGLALLATSPLRVFLVADLPTTDALSFVGTVVTLTVTSLVATLGPARRATRVDPAHALRAE